MEWSAFCINLYRQLCSLSLFLSLLGLAIDSRTCCLTCSRVKSWELVFNWCLTNFMFSRNYRHLSAIMERMEVDDSVVDLSVGSGRDTLSITPATARDLRALTQNSGLTITPALPPSTAAAPSPSSAQAAQSATSGSTSPVPGRRVLRPRTEPKSYAETPDIVLLPAKVNGRSYNGAAAAALSESEDDEMPAAPVFPIKELTAAEIWERERGLRKLREELRSEETKLVLLKKLKQSQQVMMKENLIVTPSNANAMTNNPLAGIPAALTKGSLSVTPTNAMPLPAHSKSSKAVTASPVKYELRWLVLYNLRS